VGKREEEKPLGRYRRRWEDNIKSNIQEVRWNGLEWIDLAQDRYRTVAAVNAIMKLWLP
jgi:ribosomal protein S2